jgi:hypothetical protein
VRLTAGFLTKVLHEDRYGTKGLPFKQLSEIIGEWFKCHPWSNQMPGHAHPVAKRVITQFIIRVNPVGKRFMIGVNTVKKTLRHAN